MRTLIRKTPALADLLARGFDVLRADPYNRSGAYQIRTLTAKAPGFGRWRLRLGAYRLRYDIVGQDVVLYSLAHRKDAY